VTRSFEEASKSYADCIKNPNRNPVELRARMKIVRDWDNLLAAAKGRIAGIESRIDMSIRKSALTRCNSISAQVVRDLPSEIRTQIYSNCIDWLNQYDESDLVRENGVYRNPFATRSTRQNAPAVPLVAYWLKDYPDRGPPETMKEWLGEGRPRRSR
jgi:hypothetical protein